MNAHPPPPHVPDRTAIDPRTGSRLGTVFQVALALTLVLPGPAAAIPSPDVMVNLFASAAQVLGLVSIVLGRWFFVRRARARAGAGPGRVHKAFLAASLTLCGVTSVGWYLYYASVRDAQLERLSVNLNRNSREEGRKIVDVSLKELSFGDQLKRKDGLATEEFARELEGGASLQILDVRESEEYEVGAIEKTRHVRFPDLLAAPGEYIDIQRPVTLLCFNGNRSSELAAHLESLGFDCRFMIGGYEKWLAEERPLERRGDHERRDLREIPDYANKNELLDTPDVVTLVEERNVLFVDVRYPGDFEVSHLPGAVNIPMRKLTSPELDQAIAALPKDRPIVVPCYDKRSSFFGLVMGLRVTRAGYEFLGRYTVPEGYAVPGKDKPHVAAWKAAHAPKSMLTLAAEPLGGVLGWFSEHLGKLALAILALAALLRLVCLPFTVKSERDRLVQRALAPEIERAKKAAALDPRAAADAIAGILARHRVRPIVGFVGAVLQLGLFTLFFAVVQSACEGSNERFLWLEELGEPDPTRILPLAIAGLVGAQVLLTARRPYAGWVRVVTPLAALALGALVWNLSGGVNLYLALSIAWVVAHTWIVGRLFQAAVDRPARVRERIVARSTRPSVVPLRHAHLVADTGNKAVRLGRLMEAGFTVPDGFVVRATAIRQRAQTGRFPSEVEREIESALATLPAGKVAVRSSGLNEDGAGKSYAGVFESILDVEKTRVLEALASVADSLSSDRTAAYSGENEVGGIVVQVMVPAQYAGVLFTEHPAESGTAAVEMVAGLGDALVSGRAKPRTFRLGRLTGRLLDSQTPPFDLAPLFAIGRRSEATFGRPQDMEWAFADGRIFVLQSRDITARCTLGAGERARKERERERLLELGQGASAATVVLAQNELTELLPRPRPFSLAFMNDLFAFGGSTHRAMMNLGLPYAVQPDSPPLVVGAFGAVYVNKAEEARRLARGPSVLAAFRLTRAADEIERAWREEFLPERGRAARRNEALDLARFTLEELVELFRATRAEFVEHGYVRAEEINLAADFYLKTALREIEKRGLDAAEALSHIPRTVVHEAFERLSAGDARGFLERFAHRAELDYEFACPRYGERAPSTPAASPIQSHPPAREAIAAPTGRGGVLDLALDRARRWQALKEEAKHHALRDLAFLRALLVELGRRTGLADAIFDLTPAEVARLDERAFREETAAALASSRAEDAAAFESVRLPTRVTLADLEELDVEHAGLVPHAPRSAALRGTRVSGTGGVIGRARVLTEPGQIAVFTKHEILVARYTDPTWMPVFPLCAGIVTEVGGWLSHAAIQAREFGLTAIVGVEGALDAIQTGDLLVLSGDGSVEVLSERRVERRIVVERSVRVVRGTHATEGRIRDLSSRGVQLSVEGALEIGERVVVETAWSGPLGARVIRNGVPGLYGLELDEPVDARALAEAAMAAG